MAAVQAPLVQAVAFVLAISSLAQATLIWNPNTRYFFRLAFAQCQDGRVARVFYEPQDQAIHSTLPGNIIATLAGTLHRGDGMGQHNYTAFEDHHDAYANYRTLVDNGEYHHECRLENHIPHARMATSVKVGGIEPSHRPSTSLLSMYPDKDMRRWQTHVVHADGRLLRVHGNDNYLFEGMEQQGTAAHATRADGQPENLFEQQRFSAGPHGYDAKSTLTNDKGNLFGAFAADDHEHVVHNGYASDDTSSHNSEDIRGVVVETIRDYSDATATALVYQVVTDLKGGVDLAIQYMLLDLLPFNQTQHAIAALAFAQGPCHSCLQFLQEVCYEPKELPLSLQNEDIREGALLALGAVLSRFPAEEAHQHVGRLEGLLEQTQLEYHPEARLRRHTIHHDHRPSVLAALGNTRHQRGNDALIRHALTARNDTDPSIANSIRHYAIASLAQLKDPAGMSTLRRIALEDSSLEHRIAALRSHIMHANESDHETLLNDYARRANEQQDEYHMRMERREASDDEIFPEEEYYCYLHDIEPGRCKNKFASLSRSERLAYAAEMDSDPSFSPRLRRASSSSAEAKSEAGVRDGVFTTDLNLKLSYGFKIGSEAVGGGFTSTGELKLYVYADGYSLDVLLRAVGECKAYFQVGFFGINVNVLHVFAGYALSAGYDKSILKGMFDVNQRTKDFNKLVEVIDDLGAGFESFADYASTIFSTGDDMVSGLDGACRANVQPVITRFSNFTDTLINFRPLKVAGRAEQTKKLFEIGIPHLRSITGGLADKCAAIDDLFGKYWPTNSSTLKQSISDIFDQIALLDECGPAAAASIFSEIQQVQLAIGNITTAFFDFMGALQLDGSPLPEWIDPVSRANTAFIDQYDAAVKELKELTSVVCEPNSTAPACVSYSASQLEEAKELLALLQEDTSFNDLLKPIQAVYQVVMGAITTMNNIADVADTIHEVAAKLYEAYIRFKTPKVHSLFPDTVKGNDQCGSGEYPANELLGAENTDSSLWPDGIGLSVKLSPMCDKKCLKNLEKTPARFNKGKSGIKKKGSSSKKTSPPSAPTKAQRYYVPAPYDGSIVVVRGDSVAIKPSKDVGAYFWISNVKLIPGIVKGSKLRAGQTIAEALEPKDSACGRFVHFAATKSEDGEDPLDPRRFLPFNPLAGLFDKTLDLVFLKVLDFTLFQGTVGEAASAAKDFPGKTKRKSEKSSRRRRSAAAERWANLTVASDRTEVDSLVWVPDHDADDDEIIDVGEYDMVYLTRDGAVPVGAQRQRRASSCNDLDSPEDVCISGNLGPFTSTMTVFQMQTRFISTYDHGKVAPCSRNFTTLKYLTIFSTIFRATLFSFSAAAIEKNLIRTCSSEVDESGPLFAQTSCVINQTIGEDVEVPYLAIYFQSYEAESAVDKIFVSVGYSKDGTEVLNNREFDKDTTKVPLESVPVDENKIVFAKVVSQNTFGVSSTQYCQTATRYDVTPPTLSITNPALPVLGDGQGADLVSWTNRLHTSRSGNLDFATERKLRHNEIVYLNIRSSDDKLLLSTSQDRGIVVDLTPPEPPIVYDEARCDDSAGTTSNNLPRSIRTQACDQHRNELVYHACEAAEVLDEVASSIGSRCAADDVTPHDNHLILHDAMGSIDGAFISNHRTYQRFQDFVEFGWDPAIDPETQLYATLWAVGTQPCGTDVIPWRHSDGRAAGQHGLDLREGDYYQSLYFFNSVIFGGPMSTLACQTIPLKVDVTPPSIVELKATVGSTQGSLAFNITAWDKGSGLAAHRVALGVLPVDASLVPFGGDIHQHPQFEYSFGKLPDGVYIYPQLETFDLVNLFARVGSNEPLYFDTTPPLAGEVQDGSQVEQDLSFTNDPSVVGVNFADFRDPDTGISSYWWIVRAGYLTKTGWVFNPNGDVIVNQSLPFYAAAGRVELAEPLTHATRYYSTITAYHGGLDLLSVSARSDGFMVDLTCPIASPGRRNELQILTSTALADCVCIANSDASACPAASSGYLRDGLSADWTLKAGQVADWTYSSSLHSYRMSFTGFSDPESSIARLEVAIGSRSGSVVDPEAFLDFADIDVTATTFVTERMSFADGAHVIGAVRATNGAGISTVAFTDGLIIDATPPVLLYAVDGEVASNQNEAEDSQHWVSGSGRLEQSFASVDPHSGVARVEITLYRFVGSAPALELLSTTTRVTGQSSQSHHDPNGLVIELTTRLDGGVDIHSSIDFANLPVISDGATLAARVRVYNNVGLKTQRYTSGVRIDSSPPVISDGPALGFANNIADSRRDAAGFVLVETPDTLQAYWTVIDLQSGVAGCYLRAGTLPATQSEAAKSDPASATFTPMAQFSSGGIATTELSRSTLMLTSPLTTDQYYQLELTCHNGAGLSSSARSEPFRMPDEDRIGTVVDGPTVSFDVEIQSHLQVAGHFYGFASELCGGIHSYTWGLGTSPYETDVVPLTDEEILVQGTEGVFVASLPIDDLQGQQLYALVRAKTLCRHHVSNDHPGVEGAFGQHFLDAVSSGFRVYLDSSTPDSVSLSVDTNQTQVLERQLEANVWSPITMSAGVVARHYTLTATSEDGSRTSTYKLTLSPPMEDVVRVHVLDENVDVLSYESFGVRQLKATLPFEQDRITLSIDVAHGEPVFVNDGASTFSVQTTSSRAFPLSTVNDDTLLTFWRGEQILLELVVVREKVELPTEVQLVHDGVPHSIGLADAAATINIPYQVRVFELSFPHNSHTWECSGGNLQLTVQPDVPVSVSMPTTLSQLVLTCNLFDHDLSLELTVNVAMPTITAESFSVSATDELTRSLSVVATTTGGGNSWTTVISAPSSITLLAVQVDGHAVVVEDVQGQAMHTSIVFVLDRSAGARTFNLYSGAAMATLTVEVQSLPPSTDTCLRQLDINGLTAIDPCADEGLATIALDADALTLAIAPNHPFVSITLSVHDTINGVLLEASSSFTSLAKRTWSAPLPEGIQGNSGYQGMVLTIAVQAEDGTTQQEMVYGLHMATVSTDATLPHVAVAALHKGTTANWQVEVETAARYVAISVPFDTDTIVINFPVAATSTWRAVIDGNATYDGTAATELALPRHVDNTASEVGLTVTAQAGNSESYRIVFNRHEATPTATTMLLETHSLPTTEDIMIPCGQTTVDVSAQGQDPFDFVQVATASGVLMTNVYPNSTTNLGLEFASGSSNLTLSRRVGTVFESRTSAIVRLRVPHPSSVFKKLELHCNQGSSWDLLSSFGLFMADAKTSITVPALCSEWTLVTSPNKDYAPVLTAEWAGRQLSTSKHGNVWFLPLPDDDLNQLEISIAHACFEVLLTVNVAREAPSSDLNISSIDVRTSKGMLMKLDKDQSEHTIAVATHQGLEVRVQSPHDLRLTMMETVAARLGFTNLASALATWSESTGDSLTVLGNVSCPTGLSLKSGVFETELGCWEVSPARVPLDEAESSRSFSVSALHPNILGLSSDSVSSATLVRDVTSPIADNADMNCEFDSDSSQLSCSWQGIFDEETRIQVQALMVGSQPGIADRVPAVDCGSATRVSVFVKEWVQGDLLHPSLLAFNELGESVLLFAHPVMVDAVPPTPPSELWFVPRLHDAIAAELAQAFSYSQSYNAGEVVAYQGTFYEARVTVPEGAGRPDASHLWTRLDATACYLLEDALVMRWSNDTTEAISFSVGLGSTSSTPDIAHWRPVPLDRTSAVFPGVNAAAGSEVYGLVRVEDHSGQVVITSTSAPLIVTTFKPNLALADGPNQNDVDTWTQFDRVYASWSLLGVCEPQSITLRLLRSDGLLVSEDIIWDLEMDETAPEQYAVTNLYHMEPNGEQREGLQSSRRYFFELEIQDQFSVNRNMRSDGFRYLDSSPDVGPIMDGIMDYDMDYQEDAHEFKATWHTCVQRNDKDCFGSYEVPIIRYEVAFGTGTSESNLDNLLPFTSVGLATSYTWRSTTPIASNTTVYASIRAFSAETLYATTTSDGIIGGLNKSISTPLLFLNRSAWFSDTSSALLVSWDEPESAVPLSQLELVVSSSGLPAWTKRIELDPSLTTHIIKDISALRHLDTLQVRLTAHNFALGQSTGEVAAKVDLIAPTPGTLQPVTDGASAEDLVWYATEGSVFVTVSGTFDADSGVAEQAAALVEADRQACSLSTLSCAELAATVTEDDFTTLGNLSASFNLLALESDIDGTAEALRTIVRIRDAAGLRAFVCSPLIIVDQTPPRAGAVIIGTEITSMATPFLKKVDDINLTVALAHPPADSECSLSTALATLVPVVVNTSVRCGVDLSRCTLERFAVLNRAYTLPRLYNARARPTSSNAWRMSSSVVFRKAFFGSALAFAPAAPVMGSYSVDLILPSRVGISVDLAFTTDVNHFSPPLISVNNADEDADIFYNGPSGYGMQASCIEETDTGCILSVALWSSSSDEKSAIGLTLSNVLNFKLELSLQETISGVGVMTLLIDGRQLVTKQDFELLASSTLIVGAMPDSRLMTDETVLDIVDEIVIRELQTPIAATSAVCGDERYYADQESPILAMSYGIVDARNDTVDASQLVPLSQVPCMPCNTDYACSSDLCDPDCDLNDAIVFDGLITGLSPGRQTYFCKEAEYKGACHASCPDNTYRDTRGVCQDCHAQCADNCYGPFADQCFSCENLQHGRMCVEACPNGTYASAEGVCRDCDLSCDGSCSGPTQWECESCFTGMRVASRGDVVCHSEVACPDDSAPMNMSDVSAHFSRLGGLDSLWLNRFEATATLDEFCFPCHEQCLDGCTGPLASDCISCQGPYLTTSNGITCVPECPARFFENSTTLECQACHERCDGLCTGPDEDQCVNCPRFALSTGGCVNACPSDTYPGSNGVCYPCACNAGAVGGLVAGFDLPSRHFPDDLDCGNGTAGNLMVVHDLVMAGSLACYVGEQSHFDGLVSRGLLIDGTSPPVELQGTTENVNATVLLETLDGRRRMVRLFFHRAPASNNSLVNELFVAADTAFVESNDAEDLTYLDSSPAFDGKLAFEYEVTVAYATRRLKLAWFTDVFATVSVVPFARVNSTWGHHAAVFETTGTSGVVQLLVTSEDQATMTTYTIRWTRTPPSIEDRLASLAVESVEQNGVGQILTLSPVWHSNRGNYVITLPHAAAALTLNMSVYDSSGARVFVAGQLVEGLSVQVPTPSGPSQPTSIVISVQAEDLTVPPRSYTLFLTRGNPSTTVALSNFEVSAHRHVTVSAIGSTRNVTLSPVETQLTLTSLTAIGPHATLDISVPAPASHEWTGDGAVLITGLTAATNTITITAWAQDGVTSSVSTLFVQRVVETSLAKDYSIEGLTVIDQLCSDGAGCHVNVSRTTRTVSLRVVASSEHFYLRISNAIGCTASLQEWNELGIVFAQRSATCSVMTEFCNSGDVCTAMPITVEVHGAAWSQMMVNVNVTDAHGKAQTAILNGVGNSTTIYVDQPSGPFTVLVEAMDEFITVGDSGAALVTTATSPLQLSAYDAVRGTNEVQELVFAIARGNKPCMKALMMQVSAERAVAVNTSRAYPEGVQLPVNTSQVSISYELQDPACQVLIEQLVTTDDVTVTQVVSENGASFQVDIPVIGSVMLSFTDTVNNQTISATMDIQADFVSQEPLIRDVVPLEVPAQLVDVVKLPGVVDPLAQLHDANPRFGDDIHVTVPHSYDNVSLLVRVDEGVRTWWTFDALPRPMPNFMPAVNDTLSGNCKVVSGYGQMSLEGRIGSWPLEVLLADLASILVATNVTTLQNVTVTHNVTTNATTVEQEVSIRANITTLEWQIPMYDAVSKQFRRADGSVVAVDELFINSPVTPLLMEQNSSTAWCVGSLARDCTTCPAGTMRAAFGHACVASCAYDAILVDDACQSCHYNCLGGCTGLTASDCSPVCTQAFSTTTTTTTTTTISISPSAQASCPRCRVAELNGTCLDTDCPPGYYKEEYTLRCLACHEQCASALSCSGPMPSDCQLCAANTTAKDVDSEDAATVALESLRECVTNCPNLTYVAPGGQCRACHENCLYGCSGPTKTECLIDPSRNVTHGCRAVDYDGSCEAVCPITHFSNNTTCAPCHPECQGLGCGGPSIDNCLFTETSGQQRNENSTTITFFAPASYRFAIAMQNAAGLTSVSLSPATTIDLTAPSFVGVVRFVDRGYRNRPIEALRTSSEVYFRFSVFELESPVVQVDWRLEISGVARARGSVDLDADFMGGTLVANAANLTLAQGDSVAVHLFATNAAGLVAETTSNAISVDLTPPIMDSFVMTAQSAAMDQIAVETIVNQPVSDNNNSVRFDIGANADARRRRDAAIQTILLDTPDAGFLSNMSLISIPHDVDEVQTILDSNSLDPLTLEESKFSLTSFMHPINDTLTEGPWVIRANVPNLPADEHFEWFAWNLYFQAWLPVGASYCNVSPPESNVADEYITQLCSPTQHEAEVSLRVMMGDCDVSGGAHCQHVPFEAASKADCEAVLEAIFGVTTASLNQSTLSTLVNTSNLMARHGFNASMSNVSATSCRPYILRGPDTSIHLSLNSYDPSAHCHAPMASTEALFVREDDFIWHPIALNLSDVDGDTLIVSVDTVPSKGTVRYDDGTEAWYYMSNPYRNGADSLTFRIHEATFDAYGLLNPCTHIVSDVLMKVDVFIEQVNDRPILQVDNTSVVSVGGDLRLEEDVVYVLNLMTDEDEEISFDVTVVEYDEGDTMDLVLLEPLASDAEIVDEAARGTFSMVEVARRVVGVASTITLRVTYSPPHNWPRPTNTTGVETTVLAIRDSFAEDPLTSEQSIELRVLVREVNDAPVARSVRWLLNDFNTSVIVPVTDIEWSLTNLSLELISLSHDHAQAHAGLISDCSALENLEYKRRVVLNATMENASLPVHLADFTSANRSLWVVANERTITLEGSLNGTRSSDVLALRVHDQDYCTFAIVYMEPASSAASRAIWSIVTNSMNLMFVLIAAIVLSRRELHRYWHAKNQLLKQVRLEGDYRIPEEVELQMQRTRTLIHAAGALLLALFVLSLCAASVDLGLGANVSLTVLVPLSVILIFVLMIWHLRSASRLLNDEIRAAVELELYNRTVRDRVLGLWASRSGLDDAKPVAHSGNKIFKCASCGIIYPTVAALAAHFRFLHERNFELTVAGKRRIRNEVLDVKALDVTLRILRLWRQNARKSAILRRAQLPKHLPSTLPSVRGLSVAPSVDYTALRNMLVTDTDADGITWVQSPVRRTRRLSHSSSKGRLDSVTSRQEENRDEAAMSRHNSRGSFQFPWFSSQRGRVSPSLSANTQDTFADGPREVWTQRTQMVRANRDSEDHGGYLEVEDMM
ncbi:uncharacterized protein MONBRDRAFT_8856 [Monosiga brevicollis MX1]|uniref:C2H2-type domain-containing protein n=1 Tax=Monosiga brevicollis TaxID=81824 RepID=A9V1C0_MONBE|nr:uncharacterized protein MONBRDRAFT_8856 [Monosiga brevicollis MX1]EDQ88905.1 predicted protein [Monosiga brevicollis MX1]|eukprot:XP_001746518.1 hypothetical protein [Monosiga brevicollis MX1]